MILNLEQLAFFENCLRIGLGQMEGTDKPQPGVTLGPNEWVTTAIWHQVVKAIEAKQVVDVSITAKRQA